MRGARDGRPRRSLPWTGDTDIPSRGGGSYSRSWGCLSAHPCTSPSDPCRPPRPYSLAALSIGKAAAVAEPTERSRGAQTDSLC